MTETQAKSGGSGTSTTPVEEELAEDGTPTTGRAVVGRATVPADAPSPPKFTRPPGMVPPPNEPPADGGEGTARPERPADGTTKAAATVPIVTKGSGGAVAGSTTSQPKTKGNAGGRTSSQSTVKAPAANRTAAPARPGAAADSGAKRPTGTPAGTSASTAAGATAVGAARVTEAVRSARANVSTAAGRGPRRARLNLKRIDPWSVMKFSFAVSVVLFIVVVVATSVLYLALDTMGVWEEINKSLGDLVSSNGGNSSSSGFRITAWGIIGTSMLIGAVNVVLFTALATLGAFIYNVCADLVGGVELTLAERD